MIALESRAAGVHWIFAPDADVNNNPDNPIINIRSFGEDPKRVADFVTQDGSWHRGKRRTGDRKTFSWPWQRERRFTSFAGHRYGKSQRT